MHLQKKPCHFRLIRRGGLNLFLTTRFTICARGKHTQLSLHEKTTPPAHLLIKKLERKMSPLYLFFPPVKNKHLKATVNIMKSALHIYCTVEGFVIPPNAL